MLTDNTTAHTHTAAGNLPRPVGGDAEMEASSARSHRPRGVGAAAARLALVAGLAVALLVGALALGPRGHAAAAINCEAAGALVDFYNATGNLLFSYGYYRDALSYYRDAGAMSDAAYSGGCS